MLTISYTLTPTIQDHLLAIDQARRTILTTPISLLTERKLRYQTHTADMSKQYRLALDWIRETWSANPKAVTPAAIHALIELILPPREAHRAVKDAGSTIRYVTTYLSSQKDHPVMLASVAHAELAHSPLFTVSAGRLCRLLTTLILTKYGYDCRGMLALEPEWQSTPERYRKAMASIETYGQMTQWHEYFAGTVLAALESLSHTVVRASESVLPEGVAPSLSNRQERILSLLEHPTMKITNREVQRAFHVSQITASRDLSRLASFGLLYAHGKGRSVYYTKL
ncbi:MAG: hypothetical protein AAB542_00935 [Patescibacteria group bacterium]